MRRLLYFIIGIVLCSISVAVVVIYFNLLIFGYSILDFLMAVIKNIEFYFFIPGIYLIKKDRF